MKVEFDNPANKIHKKRIMCPTKGNSSDEIKCSFIIKMSQTYCNMTRWLHLFEFKRSDTEGSGFGLFVLTGMKKGEPL